MPVKAAKDLLEATKKRFHEVNVHKNEPKFIFTQIAKKTKICADEISKQC